MSSNPLQAVHIVGGGLAGSEAAWQIASRGVPVILHEMRPVRATAVHKTERPRGTGLLQFVPLRRSRAQRRRPPARGDAPAQFAGHARGRRQPGAGRRRARGGSRRIFRRDHRGARTPIRWSTIAREEIAGLPPPDWDSVIVATGPLTSPALADAIRQRTGADALAFFDAIAPIVHRELHRPRRRLVPVALRQGRSRRLRRRLHQLPARRARNTTPSSMR